MSSDKDEADIKYLYQIKWKSVGSSFRQFCESPFEQIKGLRVEIGHQVKQPLFS